MAKRPLLVGVAGPTNSGKSTLEAGLVGVFGDELSTVSFDDLFVGLAALPGRTTDNWEHPNLYRWDAYRRLMATLAAGKEARFEPHSYEAKRDGITERVIEPRPVVVVLGFLALHDAEVNTLFDVTAYIDLKPEEMIRRRLARAAGRPAAVWNEPDYIYGMLVPATREFVDPQRDVADCIVDGAASPGEVLHEVVAAIRQHLS
ncbi:MAG TPA: hypothetical protein VLF40_01510 [Candidatus Saccharimonadales bacterium]|nr:hypothetical protein [Candidatus Saccharimonadales bacterium]